MKKNVKSTSASYKEALLKKMSVDELKSTLNALIIMNTPFASRPLKERKKVMGKRIMELENSIESDKVSIIEHDAYNATHPDKPEYENSTRMFLLMREQELKNMQEKRECIEIEEKVEEISEGVNSNSIENIYFSEENQKRINEYLKTINYSLNEVNRIIEYNLPRSTKEIEDLEFYNERIKNDFRHIEYVYHEQEEEEKEAMIKMDAFFETI